MHRVQSIQLLVYEQSLPGIRQRHSPLHPRLQQRLQRIGHRLQKPGHAPQMRLIVQKNIQKLHLEFLRKGQPHHLLR